MAANLIYFTCVKDSHNRDGSYKEEYIWLHT